MRLFWRQTLRDTDYTDVGLSLFFWEQMGLICITGYVLCVVNPPHVLRDRF